jgi:hypothetical protein
VGSLDDLIHAMMAGINHGSALFQQPGFLADVLVVRDGAARYLESFPLDRFLETAPERRDPLALVLTLEYGHQEHPDPFNIERFPQDGATSHFIHPVVRVYREGVQTAEHHVPEDLENDWSSPFYQEPFRRFLEAETAELGALAPAG